MGFNRMFLACLSTLVAMAAISEAWPSRSGFTDRELVDALRVSRRNMCVVTGGKCFSTSHCCNGLVCAAIDDYFGQKPEVPGYCVKEKDLKVCESNSDCDLDGKCMTLGRSDEKYCLPRGEERRPMAMDKGRKVSDYSKMAGGLGTNCEDDSDCKPFTLDGSDRLCCQNVRRGRQGTRQLCDRVTSISVCISVRK